MINSIKIGGLQPAPKPAPRVAPAPVEYAVSAEQFVRNVQPKQIDE
jgi:hypothetical protein